MTQREANQILLQASTYSGFLLRLYFDQGVRGILTSKNRVYLSLDAEQLFRVVYSTLGASAIVAERVDGYLCFSELDF